MVVGHVMFQFLSCSEEHSKYNEVLCNWLYMQLQLKTVVVLFHHKNLFHRSCIVLKSDNIAYICVFINVTGSGKISHAHTWQYFDK